MIGKFDLVGVQLGTAGQINQKINWAGNDFEWTTGRYYKEDRSSKIDWTGEPFRWKNGIHYDEKNTKTGVIPIIGCAPLKDTSLPASYVTTESFTSPFWGKSECLNIKNASGQHIKYEWGTTTPIAKENSVVKAISASCGQNNIGATGYVVIADEIDGLWNSSLCEKIATTTVDWSKTTTTDKKIYNLKSTRYIERMVDWSGLLFNWEESKVYDSRNLYRFPMEMIQNFGHESYVGAELRGGNSFPVMIEPLSTPPKLCFPAERKANPRGQVVYGVKKVKIKDTKDGQYWNVLKVRRPCV